MTIFPRTNLVRTLAVTLLVAAALLAPAPSEASRPQEAAAGMPVTRDLPDRGALAARELIVRTGDGGWEAVDVPNEADLAAARARIAALTGAEVAYNYRYELHATPNDPGYAVQWNLRQVDWPDAWPRADGSGVVVAVLDSGVGQGGEDLVCRTFAHPYDAVNDREGLGFVGDADGHGTHVTGTLAQCTNNGVGVAGVAPGVTVMPVKVTDTFGSIDSASVANGLAWAVAHGADVVNLSLGKPCYSQWPVCSDQAIDSEIAAAAAAGVLVVASSGNGGTSALSSPANHPAVIAVGATRRDGSRAPYSNYGSGLDLLAPGGSDEPGGRIVQETFDTAGYGYFGYVGTSMSAPHVSGAIALLQSAVPEASPEQIVSALVASAKDLDEPGWDARTGAGLLQIDAALDTLGAIVVSDDLCDPGADCDSVIFADTEGRWHRWNELRPGAGVGVFYFGNPGDVGFTGDWDCDGVSTPGLYRQSDGFVYLRNSNTEGIADRAFFFGNPGDVPVSGDFDGDGCDTVSVYRPAEGRVYVVNELGGDGGGLGPAEYDYYFGNPGDAPFAGDFDGDGVDTVGLHRASTGLVYFRNVHSAGPADAEFVYGDPADHVFAGDWDGDGIDSVAAYRPATATLYVKLANAAGNADLTLLVGDFVAAARS